MMGLFEELLAVIGDNAKAKEIVERIRKAQDDLADKYNAMEVKFNEAKEGRDKVKAQLRVVKSKLGIEEISEEVLDEALKKNKNGDNALKAEIDNLKNALKEEVEKKKQIEQSYKTKLQEMALDNAFANSGLVELAANKETLKILKMLAKEGAVLGDDGKIVFRNEDGSTKMVEGRAMTIEDRVKELAANEAYAGLFKPQTKGGAGTPPDLRGGIKGGQVEIGKVSAVELMKMGRKGQQT